MPDITMCSSKTCTVTRTCRRHPDSGTVPFELWQGWFTQSPLDKCEYYWEVEEKSGE